MNRPTILIVDDNKKNLQVLGNILNEQNYRVAMAINGSTALKLSEKISPDLIILDIMMPEMDGFEVCKILKSQVNTSKIPIIFLSAKIDLEDIVRGFKLGGADYITKPFKKEELLVRIQTQIEISEGRKKIQQQSNELEALNKLKDEFLDVLISEIRKTLQKFNDIPKLDATLLSNLTPQNINEVHNEFHIKTENTQQSLENVLWWSQSQQNLIQVNVTPVELSKALEQIKEKLSTNANFKHISIKLNIDNSIIFADKVLLQMVLKNIILNAIKFSNSNSVITCTSTKTEKTTVVHITDNGIGINKEELSMIQNKLNTPKEFRTPIKQNNGIGLIVTNELLLLMNASINIESEKGKGTIVKLIFQNEAFE